MKAAKSARFLLAVIVLSGGAALATGATEDPVLRARSEIYGKHVPREEVGLPVSATNDMRCQMDNKPKPQIRTLRPEEVLWEPTPEIMDTIIAALKSTPDNLWEQLKAIEAKNGTLWDEAENRPNETFNRLDCKLRELHPELNDVQRGVALVLRLRSLARKELGIVDPPRPAPKNRG